jgi:hypothetical protein
MKMKTFKLPLLKTLLGSLAIIGGGSALTVLVTNCGDNGP